MPCRVGCTGWDGALCYLNGEYLVCPLWFASVLLIVAALRRRDIWDKESKSVSSSIREGGEGLKTSSISFLSICLASSRSLTEGYS